MVDMSKEETNETAVRDPAESAGAESPTQAGTPESPTSEANAQNSRTSDAAQADGPEQSPEVGAPRAEPAEPEQKTGKPSGEKEGGSSGEPVQIPAAEYRELQEKAAKADEYWDRLLRERAELDNFKKRAVRDRLEAIRYANEDLLERLLPIMDNFEMALQAAENPDNASVESIKTGITMIHGQLKSFLAEAGLEEIDALGKKFDHNHHEAISHQESEEAEEETVIQQTRKGYKLRERLLRPASVVVAKKPSPEDSSGEQK